MFRKQILEDFLSDRPSSCQQGALAHDHQLQVVPTPLPIICQGDEPTRTVSRQEITTVEARNRRG